MIFGEVQTHKALHCILAHSLRISDGRIRKGTLLNAEHIQRLLSNGIEQVTVAKLDENDIHEDEAAQQLAETLVGSGIKLGQASTGRVNCYAITAGLLTIPRNQLLAVNNISEAITASTLPENRWVEAGKMVATCKIIPYAVASEILDLAIQACAAELTPPDQTVLSKQADPHTLCVHPAVSRRAHLVQTTMPDMSPSLLEKTEQVTSRRLTLRNVQLTASTQCVHNVHDLSEHLKLVAAMNEPTPNQPANNWILISGASAISDRQDVIPQALEKAGGKVIRCGIPVDPGNLLMLGEVGQSTVIGIPGCARSPKHNGLDLFMDRLACNLPITQHWINSLAIGGLMDEIIGRPTPRSHGHHVNTTVHTAAEARMTNVTAILLAGGESKRFGADNKLLAERQGRPLITHALSNLINSRVEQLIIVVGYDAADVESYCRSYLNDHHGGTSMSVEFVVNPDFASGMSSSLKTGVSALLNQNSKNVTVDPHAALVCLADMPSIVPATINMLVDTMRQEYREEPTDLMQKRAAAYVPTYQGKRGNPVLLMPELFDLLLDLSDDVGARHLLQANRDAVSEVPVRDNGIFLDCDTPEQLLLSEQDIP